MTSLEKQETSSEIEREVEISRARLAATLDQLRDNLTPQHIADELLGNARDGASAVLKSLGETAAENPVPALLISAACMMLFSSGKVFGKTLSTDSNGYIPGPDGQAVAAFAGNKPMREGDLAAADDSVEKSRWAALGQRPLVTAMVGVVIGAALAAMFPRAKSEVGVMSDKLNAVAAE
jgi:ElaB/YqjD/DUF883 family membrane-anchored ribosome-binding protein